MTYENEQKNQEKKCVTLKHVKNTPLTNYHAN